MSPSTCSTLESGKGGNLEHALSVMDGLGLTMLVVPKVHAPWLEQAAAHTAKIGEDAARKQHAWLEEQRAAIRMSVRARKGSSIEVRKR